MSTQSKWRCPKCRSTEVQISLPTWYTESADGELTMVETDAEADVSWWYCEACGETDSGEPERHEREAQPADCATPAQVF